MKQSWNKVYADSRSTWSPTLPVLQFTARYLKRRIGIDRYDFKKDVRRVLDFGCGNGNNVMFFAEQGFETYGIDVSERAIDIAKNWAKNRGFKVDLRVGNALLYEDNFFDVVISDGVLDHITLSDAKKTMKEIKRVLSPNGYSFITLRSTEDSEFGRGEKVDHNTFVLSEGYEKGLIQHYFDIEEIKKLFQGFKVFDIGKHDEIFSDIFSVDKAYFQSTQTVEKRIDLESLNLNMKYSRWYVASEVIK